MRTIFSFLFAVTALYGWGWGQKGHDVVAAIAERHLTPHAQAAVADLLNGRSMVYWANWLDNASNTPEYAYTKTWHYKDVDEGVNYEDQTPNPKGDAVTAICGSIDSLKNAATKREAKVLALKILIHVVGDIHQPMHTGHTTDLGGNRYKVKFFGGETNLHKIWDGSILEAGHKWSYTEWADQLDRLSPEEAQALAAGTVDDWAKHTVELATELYKETPEESNVSYGEVARWTPVIEQQLLAAGIRLAEVLNNLF